MTYPSASRLASRSAAPDVVDLRTPALARAWAIRFGLSVEELQHTVRRTGNAVSSVEQYLRDVMRGERAKARNAR